MVRSWQFDDYAIDALTQIEKDRPPLGDGDVRVAVRAVSLNYRDLLVLEGWVSRDLELPVVPLSTSPARLSTSGPAYRIFQSGTVS